MPEDGDSSVKLFFYSIFAIGAVLFTALNITLRSDGVLNASFIVSEISALFFTALAFVGVNKGVSQLTSGFDELRANPGALKMNLYSELAVLVFLLAIILFDYAMISAGYGLAGFFVGTLLFGVFLLSLKMMEYITKGALAIHLIQNISPMKAVLKSLSITHRYLAIEVYMHLFKISGFMLGRITDSLLVSRGFPTQILSQGTDIALSYATFYAALGNSATESVINSVQKTIDNPTETTFLNLGTAAVLLLSTVFLVIPIAIFFAVFLLTWDAFGGVAIILASVPFLTGLLFYIYLFTVPATAGEIALLRKLS